MDGHTTNPATATVVELSADDILSVDDTKPVPFEVPEWPKNGCAGVIYLKPWTAEDVTEWIDLMDGPAKRNAMVLAVIRSVVSKDGVRTFTEKHLEALKQKSMAACHRIQKRVLEMNGLSQELASVTLAAAKNG